MKASNDTIFALATQRGKSGIAVFRVSGKGSHKTIKSISSKKKFKIQIFLITTDQMKMAMQALFKE